MRNLTKRWEGGFRAVRRGLAAVLLCALAAGCTDVKQWFVDEFFGPTGDELLIMVENEEDPDVRREAIVVMCRRDWDDRTRLYRFLTFMVEDEDPSVRSAAIRGLSRSQDPNYLPLIVNRLTDPEEATAVRWDAAVALDRIHGEDAVEPLLRHSDWRQEESMDVRMACTRALRHYRRKPVVEALVARLSDPSFEVRYEASRALWWITGERNGLEPQSWAGVVEGDLGPAPVHGVEYPWWDWMEVSEGSLPSDPQPQEQERTPDASETQ